MESTSVLFHLPCEYHSPPYEESDFSFMGEALMFKVYEADPAAGLPEIPTNGMFTQNIKYTCTYTGNYLITCVGGGGASGSGVANNMYWASQVPSYIWESDDEGWGYGMRANVWGHGGGSGYWNAKVVKLNRGDVIDVTIGAGGVITSSTGGTGGTTSFGDLVSAAGGAGGQSPSSYGLTSNSTNSSSMYSYFSSNKVGGAGGNNGYASFYVSWSAESYESGRSVSRNMSRNGVGGLVLSSINAAGFPTVGSGSRLYFGDGANTTKSTTGAAGNSGVIFVNYVN